MSGYANIHHQHQASDIRGGVLDLAQIPNLPASKITSGLMDTARLGSGTADATKVLRGDRTWATPTATIAATTVEVDLGDPKFRGRFTITDAAIGPTSKVLCWQAPGPYTGKGTRADEAEMQPVHVIAVVPGSGSALVLWETPPAYTLGIPDINLGPRDALSTFNTLTLLLARMLPKPQRFGKVEGNVKFSYVVLA